ncbi:phosphatidylinositol 3- and 4-kinase family protein [Arabidopsis thaliana]|uniref:Phosphatidylinositol 3-and 4-kinase family protein n=1 Tax=Arabidopsis thaliana TaxID=3702 RepID=F4HSY8_ARATH|nr:phosphatidylinositol 3- and 4-kinase family protein [Arabidopsis thaliana]AEE30848.1 phosphatidylinositol 3- and 4-kinase family protein [Arabidopsis thaliana]|eukprot:NP_001154375.1 phosphatidylinositol 3- and 4-kinase family protein [Arabidopsis thaliana]
MAAPADATTKGQALALLAAAKNHGDLAVKLSSLKEVKEILLSLEPSLSAEIFPYLRELCLSPEVLVRRSLIEIIEEVEKSISTGTTFFRSILEKMETQVHTVSQVGYLVFHHRGKVDRWCVNLWTLMLMFKDAVFNIALDLERRYYVLIMQFLLLLFRLYCILSGTAPYMLCSFCCARVNFSNSTAGSRQMINISSLAAGLPMLNLTGLMSEVNQTLVRLGSFLQAPTLIQDALPIAVIDCSLSFSLAVVARKRPVHYDTVLSVLGFLKCTSSPIVESRDLLFRAFPAMDPADISDQVVREVDELFRVNEHAANENRSSQILEVFPTLSSLPMQLRDHLQQMIHWLDEAIIGDMLPQYERRNDMRQVLDRDRRQRCLFKRFSDEDRARNEAIAYLLDHPEDGHRSQSEQIYGFSRVRRAVWVRCRIKNQMKMGVLIEFLESSVTVQSLGTVYSELPDDVGAEEIHKIVVLDIRFGNIDRNLGNLLVQAEPRNGSAAHLVPIDHELSFFNDAHPYITCGACWIKWLEQIDKDFSSQLVNYVAALDPDRDLEFLRHCGWEPNQRYIENFTVFATFLKKAVSQGLTALQIGLLASYKWEEDLDYNLHCIVASVQREDNNFVESVGTRIEQRLREFHENLHGNA